MYVALDLVDSRSFFAGSGGEPLTLHLVLQLDELQYQLQKKLLGSNPAASAKPRASAAPAASNAVTYTSAGSGPSHASCGDDTSYSDGLPTHESAPASAPGTHRRSGSAQFSSSGPDQRSDANRSTVRPSNDDWDDSADRGGFGGSRSNGRRGGSSLHQDSGLPYRQGSGGTHGGGWREGMELEPSSAGGVAGSRQRAASRSGVRTAAAAIAACRVQGDTRSAWRPLKPVQRLPARLLCRTTVLQGRPVFKAARAWL